jgi:hypothetical protein
LNLTLFLENYLFVLKRIFVKVIWTNTDQYLSNIFIYFTCQRSVVYWYRCRTTDLKVYGWIPNQHQVMFFYVPRKISGEHIVVGLSVPMYVLNLCPAHNFVIWSQILKRFHRNHHHIKTTCHAQHLGRFLEGQGHSMTLQQNCVRPITSLFEVGF